MNPATQLKGLKLEGGWTVQDFAVRKPNATGGHFSQGYIVVDNQGRRGFLKAMDYTKALQSPLTAETLLAMTQAYVFEKVLCEKCAHLSRVARAIGSGWVQTDRGNPYHKVEYLIFELADHDIRAYLDTMDVLDLVFMMKTLHHVATGLQQLHNAKIAHQDLKPSNVLIYSAAVGSKICDLGRAWDGTASGPWDLCEIAGDQTYAPPELLYRAVPTDVHARRFGCDMYHLGSLAVFMFTRAHTNALISESLDPHHRPGFWSGSYAEVLPFLQAAFDVALMKFAGHVSEWIRSDLHQIVAELCEPDPSRRGLPRNSKGNQYSLERYISKFDHLAYHAQGKLN